MAAVTAASSLEAAQSVAPHISGNPYYLDINSVSPGRKKETARLLDGTARYVDVAILAPIHPKRHQTPLLLAGPHAQAVLPLLVDELEMQGVIASDEVGAAAALKMIRSVMIKGIEALTAECFLAAQRAGITDEVAASLKNNYPALDWPKVIAYNLERMASHGIRRADEMEQVAVTLARTWHRAADDAGDGGAPARDGRARQAGERQGGEDRRRRRAARCRQQGIRSRRPRKGRHRSA